MTGNNQAFGAWRRWVGCGAGLAVGGLCLAAEPAWKTVTVAAATATVEPAANDASATLPPVIITATRTAHALTDVPATGAVVTAAELEEKPKAANLPEALSGEPGVALQKTANGQTSPYVRGFTGFRNLLLVDGVRFNNSVFRDGPNQYWNLIDALSLERIELVKGPGSVLYGSDAVGGVVNAITADTGLQLSPDAWEGHLRTSYATAEHATTAHLSAAGNVRGKLGYYAGVTGKQIGDIRGGRALGNQRQTGYDEWNGLVKLEWLLAPDCTLSLSHLHGSQDDVWRTHRTVFGVKWENLARGSDRQLSTDQAYDLSSLQLRARNLDSAVEAITAGVSWQRLAEDEYQLKTDFASQQQGFRVNTYGAFVSLESPSALGRWTYGVDWYRDSVDSWKRSFNAAGVQTDNAIQGPVADAATYDTAGAFLQNELPLGDRVDLVTGARLSYAAAAADKVRDPRTGAPSSLANDWLAVPVQGRLLLGLDAAKTWQWFAGVGQSFRAPNLSDLTRFDIARTNEQETAAPGLEPEEFLTYETGVRANRGRWGGELSVFRTEINHLIVRVPTGDTVVRSGTTYRIVEKRNSGRGYVEGVELTGHCQATDEWRVTGNFTWMDGEVDGYPTSSSAPQREYITRLMPATTGLALRYEPAALSGKLFLQAELAVATAADRLSSSDRADTQRIPPGGTPGYTVWNAKAGYRFTPDVRLTCALENVTNTDYRIHGSGVNEPGRSLVTSLDVRF